MRTAAALLMFSLLAAAPPVEAQRHTVTADEVSIYNLAGSVTVTGTASGDLEVEITPRGRDADQLQVHSERAGARHTLRIRPPGDRVLFPGMGWGSRSTLRVTDDGVFLDDDMPSRGRTVQITRRGRGVEAYADVTVRVPPGRAVNVHVGVGRVDVREVEADVRVRTASAPSEIAGVRGSLAVRTSSGGASVASVDGDVTIHSSSGRVRADGLRGGSHSIRTSSGSIEARDVSGGSVDLTASSGRVTVSGLDAREASARTSSGSIRIEGARVDRLETRASSGRTQGEGIEVGEMEARSSSGSVDLGFVGGLRSLVINAGSGSVRAAIPSRFGGDVEIRTGSGSIRSEMPLEVTRSGRSELVGRIGQGQGTLRVRTGSGSVRLAGG